MFARGPGIRAGRQIDAVTTHTDVSSTLLEIAGAKKQTDGCSMPLLESQTGMEDTEGSEHASVEFWGPAVPEGFYGTRTDLNREAGKFSILYPNNTYKGLRLSSKDYSLYYAVWCTNETELYNLENDPFQIKNLMADPASYDTSTIAGRSLSRVIPRLDALIMVLKTCKGSACTSPWKVLHTSGEVASLSQALSPAFDAFYMEQPKMIYYGCPLAYYAGMETQEPIKTFEQTGSMVDQSFDYTNHWHLLT